MSDFAPELGSKSACNQSWFANLIVVYATELQPQAVKLLADRNSAKH